MCKVGIVWTRTKYQEREDVQGLFGRGRKISLEEHQLLHPLKIRGVLPRSDFQGMEELMLSGLAIFEVLDEDEVRSAKMCKVGID